MGWEIVRDLLPAGRLDIRTASAQVTAVSQTAIRQMPTGTQPPLILNYNASTVPILQLAMSSQVLSEQQVLDLSQNFIRPQLTTVKGAALPYPYGGKTTPRAAADGSRSPCDAGNGTGFQPADVESAFNAPSETRVNPVGTCAKIGILPIHGPAQ